MQKIILFPIVSIFLSLTAHAQIAATFRNKSLLIEFDSQLRSRIPSLTSKFRATEAAAVETRTSEKPTFVSSFALTKQANDKGQLLLTGENSLLRKEIVISQVPEFSNAILFQVSYTNISRKPLKLKSLIQNRYRWSTGEDDLWSLQPGSYDERPDWMVPMKRGFFQKNFLGMNTTDYGGGTPVSAVWNKDSGLAVGSWEPQPPLISLPISFDNAGNAQLGIEMEIDQTLLPGETYQSVKTFVANFSGDPFQTLRSYSKLMAKQGLEMSPSPKKQVGPIWCGWGYGRTFTVSQILETLPVAKSLGFEWVGIDDGWQSAIGDWTPNPSKFPNGEADIKRLVDEVHRQGMKIQLWWAPLAAHQSSDYLRKFSTQLLLKEDQKPRDITFWDSLYLCPAHQPVRDEMKRLAHQFIHDWGFDGLKIDGQHLNAAGECFNADHHHSSPQVSIREHGEVFRDILAAAKKANPNVLVETCPCGTSYSVYNLPHQNMTVASDPGKSRQVRQKGKILRALTGDDVIYFGDHVELSDDGVDFASTIGIGGLPGSNFTLSQLVTNPPMPDEAPSVLTSDRYQIWKKWLPIAKAKQLWLGQYRGDLYDVAYDRPETHAVEKDNSMFYGSFASNYRGRLELRGLKPNVTYEITNYVDHRTLGKVVGPVAQLNVRFEKYLLLEAKPVSHSNASR